MTDHDALLRAVIENPDDDTPRLVYADWCDENDRPERAELIRGQCYLARTKGDPGAGERPRWQRRVREVLRRHSARWRAELPRPFVLRWGQYRRGMIEDVHVGMGPPDVTHFRTADWDRLLAVGPLEYLGVGFRVASADAPTLGRHLLGWTGLRRFRTFLIGTYLGGRDEAPWVELARLLGQHDWSGGPEVLALHAGRDSDPALRVLAGVPADHHMPVIDLGGSPLGTDIRAALLRRYGERIRL